MSIKSCKPPYSVDLIKSSIKGYPFKQNIEVINGKSYFEYSESSYERMHWGELSQKSKEYREALYLMSENSHYWKDEVLKDDTFDIIFHFLKKKKTFDSITKMFPFEIWLINNGFKMIGFDGLNAHNPCFSLCADKIVDDAFTNPSGVKYSREYHNGEKTISICFGYGATNFYFTIDRDFHKNYQVPINENDFLKGINGKLNELI